MASQSREALASFVDELLRLRAACGSPTLHDLVAHSADLPHPLARSTISDKLNAKSLPGWDFVVSFVEACRSHAEKTGAQPPPEALDIALWDAKHLRLLRDLDVLRPDERPAAAATASSLDSRPVPRLLPAAVRRFAGRAEQLRLLASLADEAATDETAVHILAIHGTAGVGKTALAVHAAHLLANRFPDGSLYVDLRGFDPGGHLVTATDALRALLIALSVPPEQLPASTAAQMNLYRTLLADRRVLILLDNARDAEHVRPLVPGTPGSLVVVTSRDRLTSLVARDGAYPMPLHPLTDDEARQLLAGRMGIERVRGEANAIDEIIARCARLPLALSVVAARASLQPATTLAELAGGLRAAPDALDILDSADPAIGIRPMLSWSYRQLSDDAASLFRGLALHPGPDVSPGAAASLAGLPERKARAALNELADAHLIEEHRPARFEFHDLLRAYAGELSESMDSAAERSAAVERLLRHYLHIGHQAALVLEPHRPPLALDPNMPGATFDAPADQAAAQRWFATERQVLLGLVELAAKTGFDGYAWRLAWTVTDFLNRHGHWHDWVRTQRIAVTAAERLGDRPALALMYRNVIALVRLERYDEARRSCRRALALHRELGDLGGRAHAHLNLGGIALTLADQAQGEAERRSRQRTALRHASRALDLFETVGDQVFKARALNSVGWAHAQLGDFRQTIVVCERALALLEELGAKHAQADTWDSLGFAHVQTGDHTGAAARYQRAAELYAELGDRQREAETLTHLGEAQLHAGDTTAARAAWAQALAILVDLGHPSADSLDLRLAELSRL
ncbi:MAG TPA: NB-ARC domain-containing protein [Candidatus Limnocylindrales bacterium]